MRYSKEYRKKLFEKNQDWLMVVYQVGRGMMLRQQMITFAVECCGINKIDAEVRLSELNRAGLVTQVKAFANCKNLVVCYSKSLAAVISKSSSRDSWIPKFTTSNILYHIFKTELVIEYLERVGKDHFLKIINHSLVIVPKNKAIALYDYFDNAKGFNKKIFFTDDYKAVKRDIKSIGMPKHQTESNEGEKSREESKDEKGDRYDKYNFTKFLSSNFLISGIIRENGGLILKVYYLRISRTKTNIVYDHIKCMLRMFNHYFEELNQTFDKISVTIVSFNSKELISIKKSWNDKGFRKHMGENYSQLADLLEISYKSIELDKKYHLSRDL